MSRPESSVADVGPSPEPDKVARTKIGGALRDEEAHANNVDEGDHDERKEEDPEEAEAALLNELLGPAPAEDLRAAEHPEFTFDEALRIPGLKQLLKYLACDKYAQESFKFLDAVTAYKTLEIPAERVRYGMAILDSFFPNGESNVNISGDEQKELKAAFANLKDADIPRSVFDRAEDTILRLVRSDVYREFLQLESTRPAFRLHARTCGRIQEPPQRTPGEFVSRQRRRSFMLPCFENQGQLGRLRAMLERGLPEFARAGGKVFSGRAVADWLHRRAGALRPRAACVALLRRLADARLLYLEPMTVVQMLKLQFEERKEKEEDAAEIFADQDDVDFSLEAPRELRKKPSLMELRAGSERVLPLGRKLPLKMQPKDVRSTVMVRGGLLYESVALLRCPQRYLRVRLCVYFSTSEEGSPANLYVYRLEDPVVPILVRQNICGLGSAIIVRRDSPEDLNARMQAERRKSERDPGPAPEGLFVSFPLPQNPEALQVIKNFNEPVQAEYDPDAEEEVDSEDEGFRVPESEAFGHELELACGHNAVQNAELTPRVEGLVEQFYLRLGWICGGSAGRQLVFRLPVGSAELECALQLRSPGVSGGLHQGRAFAEYWLGCVRRLRRCVPTHGRATEPPGVQQPFAFEPPPTENLSGLSSGKRYPPDDYEFLLSGKDLAPFWDAREEEMVRLEEEKRKKEEEERKRKLEEEERIFQEERAREEEGGSGSDEARPRAGIGRRVLQFAGAVASRLGRSRSRSRSRSQSRPRSPLFSRDTSEASALARQVSLEYRSPQSPPIAEQPPGIERLVSRFELVPVRLASGPLRSGDRTPPPGLGSRAPSVRPQPPASPSSFYHLPDVAYLYGSALRELGLLERLAGLRGKDAGLDRELAGRARWRDLSLALLREMRLAGSVLSPGQRSEESWSFLVFALEQREIAGLPKLLDQVSDHPKKLPGAHYRLLRGLIEEVFRPSSQEKEEMEFLIKGSELFPWLQQGQDLRSGSGGPPVVMRACSDELMELPSSIYSDEEGKDEEAETVLQGSSAQDRKLSQGRVLQLIESLPEPRDAFASALERASRKASLGTPKQLTRAQAQQQQRIVKGLRELAFPADRSAEEDPAWVLVPERNGLRACSEADLRIALRYHLVREFHASMGSNEESNDDRKLFERALEDEPLRQLELRRLRECSAERPVGLSLSQLPQTLFHRSFEDVEREEAGLGGFLCAHLRSLRARNALFGDIGDPEDDRQNDLDGGLASSEALAVQEQEEAEFRARVLLAFRELHRQEFAELATRKFSRSQLQQ